jgi:hypothetical protein
MGAKEVMGASVFFPWYKAAGHTTQTVGRLVYRRIGGIYGKDHFRVYWRDGNVTKPPPTIRMYDGMERDGAVMRGIPTADPFKAVESRWSGEARILFFLLVGLDPPQGCQ